MKRFVALLAASGFAAAVVMLLSWTVFFEQINFIAYDFTMRLSGAVAPESPVTIVAIDEESLLPDAGGPWPWKREQLARLVERVAAARPRVVALDLLLELSDRQEGDAALADAIAKAAPTILPARMVGDESGARWVQPMDTMLSAGVRLGHVHTDGDFDGINRRIAAWEKWEGRILPAFAIETLRAAGEPIDPSFEPETYSGEIIVQEPTVGIRFAGDTGETFAQVPAWKVLEGVADAESLRDRIVLIGVTAEAFQQDQWFTPFSRSGLKMPGVEIHANAIDTLFARRWIREVPMDIFFLSLFASILGLVWIDRRFEGVRFYVVAVLCIPAIVLVSWALMKYANVWLPFPPFLAAIVLVLPGLEVRKIVRVNRDLDSKIAKLSSWGDKPALPEWSAADVVRKSAPSGPQRDAWLETIRSFEDQTSRRRDERGELMESRWRNSKWRLGAVDFFNEELFRFLDFNNAVLGSIEDVTIVSDVCGRVVYQNPAARRLEGYRETAPFAATYFSNLLDGRDFVPAFGEVFGEEKTVALQFVPGRNGRQMFHAVLAPIGRTGLVLSLHDATAQHELNLAKNEMVSLVSHELRTPLTAIKGYSDMLLKYGLVEEKGRQFLGTILEESDRLGKLIQSFLDVAYIESGRQKVSKSDFEVAPMFRDLRSVIDPVAAAKEIRIETDGGNVSSIRADRTLLYQALSNLVTNAVKYSPGGTTVRVAASNGNGRVAFRVADEGYGIPPEDASRIFDKFYRRPNKETVEQSGFGLGLAFVKEVALRHGGEVTVMSEVGKGSVFTLHIPYER